MDNIKITTDIMHDISTNITDKKFNSIEKNYFNQILIVLIHSYWKQYPLVANFYKGCVLGFGQVILDENIHRDFEVFRKLYKHLNGRGRPILFIGTNP